MRTPTLRNMLLAIALAGSASAQDAAPKAPAAPRAPVPPANFRRTEPRLAPGDSVAFPRLEPFVRGETRQSFEPGKIVVFEAFSTTCSHCEEHFELIREIVHAFRAKGVEFISVTAEPADKVNAWLAKPGKEQVDWSVACDPAETVGREWQNATLRNFTPRFFVVRDGRLLWAGHPNMSEKPLQQIVEGTFDADAARKEFCLDATVTAANAMVDSTLRKCQDAADWQPLFDLFDQIVQQVPERAGTFQVERFGAMIGPANRVDAGYAFGRSLMQQYAGDGRVLRALARSTLTNVSVRRRDVDFAMQAAQAADALGKGQDPKALEVLGLAWFAKGDRGKAIEFVERASKIETERKFQKQYERTLARFRKDAPGPMPDYQPKRPDGKPVAAPPADGG